MLSKTQTCYLPEVREKAVAVVFDTRTSGESLKSECQRVSPLVSVKFATFYNWCENSRLVTGVAARKAQTVGELEAEVRLLRRELRETKRANEILKAAATLLGRRSTANRRSSRVRSSEPRRIRGRSDL